MYSCRALAVAASLATISCADPLFLDGYDRSCIVDTDCVSVQIGDVCDCDTDHAAINRNALSTYQAEFDKARDRCTGCNAPCYPRRVPPAARCNSGKCIVIPYSADAGPLRDSRPVIDLNPHVRDAFTFTCKSLDAGYERSECTTNLSCSSIAQCPKDSPVKCPGHWACAGNVCVYRCWVLDASVADRSSPTDGIAAPGGCTLDPGKACWTCGTCPGGQKTFIGCKGIGDCALFCTDCMPPQYAPCPPEGDPQCANWKVPRGQFSACVKTGTNPLGDLYCCSFCPTFVNANSFAVDPTGKCYQFCTSCIPDGFTKQSCTP